VAVDATASSSISSGQRATTADDTRAKCREKPKSARSRIAVAGKRQKDLARHRDGVDRNERPAVHGAENANGRLLEVDRRAVECFDQKPDEKLQSGKVDPAPAHPGFQEADCATD
jgi:hypothetical protein